MVAFRGETNEERSATSKDFDHALMREVMRTELVRIKALIATSVLLSLFITGLYLFDPYAVTHLWHGTMHPSALFYVLIPFVLFELWVHATISRHLKMDRDIPFYRRYIGALIETTMPTIALALHIQNMGPTEALGFVGPLAYFIFIILSRFRLDSCLSPFTAAASTRTPQDTVDRLDGAFALLVEILDRHGGIVNKFLGDGFLALFGAPFEAEEAPHRAVAAARDMLVAMDDINEGASWPLRIGIGIHFGEVVAGNIGSPRRKEYTVIGDTVNFASRLEALNKEFGSQLLISAAVREVLGEDCDDAVALGEVEVRGYEQKVPVFQLG